MHEKESSMSATLNELVDVLTLEQLGETNFQGKGSHGDGANATFGGHFLGQATAAAQATVEADRVMHSLHAYFLRAGTPGEPIYYDVERVRDGRSFCTRRVRAHQGNKTAFEMTASFTVAAQGPEIKTDPPPDFTQLPAPEDLPRYLDLMRSHNPPPFPADWALREHGIDVRVVNAPWSPNGPSDKRGIRMWIRANGVLAPDPNLHIALLAYQSDESISDNVLVPFDVTWGTPGVFFVSLDHALWIHRRVNLNEWHFVDQAPVTAANSRGTSVGNVWSTGGELVASFSQESLMRIGHED
jgi:acyl-CoA thioesterase-2